MTKEVTTGTEREHRIGIRKDNSAVIETLNTAVYDYPSLEKSAHPIHVPLIDYPIVDDQRVINDYLYPSFLKKKRPQKSLVSSIPGNNDPLFARYTPGAQTLSSIKASAQYHVSYPQGIQCYPETQPLPADHPYEVVAELQNAHSGQLKLTPETSSTIAYWRAGSISLYLFLAVPVTYFIIDFTLNTTVPMDPLFDFIVIFIAACVLVDLAMACRNHMNMVTTNITSIAYRSTYIEMKAFSTGPAVSPMLTATAAPITPAISLPGQALRATDSQDIVLEQGKNAAIIEVSELDRSSPQDPVPTIYEHKGFDPWDKEWANPDIEVNKAWNPHQDSTPPRKSFRKFWSSQASNSGSSDTVQMQSVGKEGREPDSDLQPPAPPPQPGTTSVNPPLLTRLISKLW